MTKVISPRKNSYQSKLMSNNSSEHRHRTPRTASQNNHHSNTVYCYSISKSLCLLLLGIAFVCFNAQIYFEHHRSYSSLYDDVAVPLQRKLHAAATIISHADEIARFLLEKERQATSQGLLLRSSKSKQKYTTSLTPKQERAQAAAMAGIGKNGDGRFLSQTETLILTLSNGKTMRVVLRPDWSYESVQHIRNMVEHFSPSDKFNVKNDLLNSVENAETSSSCTGESCQFYIVEHKGSIMQGTLGSTNKNSTFSPSTKIPRGSCPAGLESIINNCDNRQNHYYCGPCHGPILEPGMVAWAAGATGPDFFVYLHNAQHALWWGTQHTVWGQVTDVSDLELLRNIAKTSKTYVNKNNRIHYMEDPLTFIDMKIELTNEE